MLKDLSLLQDLLLPKLQKRPTARPPKKAIAHGKNVDSRPHLAPVDPPPIACIQV